MSQDNAAKPLYKQYQNDSEMELIETTNDGDGEELEDEVAIRIGEMIKSYEKLNRRYDRCIHKIHVRRQK